MKQNNEKILFKNYLILQVTPVIEHMSYFNVILLFNINKISINIHEHLFINCSHGYRDKGSEKTTNENIW